MPGVGGGRSIAIGRGSRLLAILIFALLLGIVAL
jgi:hypothetical protein